MQRKKGNSKKTVRKTNRKEIKIEDFLMEGNDRFDEEDEDNVTGDTLEFLSLDDDMIEAYNRKHRHADPGRKTSGSRYVNKNKEEAYEDIMPESEAGAGYGKHERVYAVEEADDNAYEDEEEYEYNEDDEAYEDEEEYEYGEDEEAYEDEEEYEYGEDEEAYEDEEEYEYGEDEETYEDEEEYEYGEDDEAYEDDEEYEYGEDDDEYEDEEEYEYDEDDEYDDEEEYEYDAYSEQDGIIVRIKDLFSQMSALDMVVAMLGIVVLAGAILSGGLYLNAKSVAKQVDAFASVGEEMAGISVIGESGLIAVSESARLSVMIDLEEETSEEQEEQGEEKEEDKNGTIEVVLNLTTIQSDLKIKFVNKSTGKLIGSVPFEVEVSGKKSMTMKDDDKDGIIYQTGIAAGDYSVKIIPFTDNKYADYKLPSSASSITVKDTITYKKVDVADEVKTEAEVNAAAEDTAQQNTVVESVLKDTVEWVESTKTPIGDEKATYTEVDKKNIPDPWTVSGAYLKMVATEEGAASSTETLSAGNAGARTATGDPGTGETNGSGNSGGDNTGGDGTGGTTEGNGTSSDTTGGNGSGGSQDSGAGGNQGVNFSVSISSSEVKLKENETSSLTVTASVDGEVQAITWASSEPGVVEVGNNGSNTTQITAKSAGTAQITASVTISGTTKTSTCTVTVDAATQQETPTQPSQPTVTLPEFELNSTSLSIKKGASASLAVQPAGGAALPSGIKVDVAWKSSDTAVAEVSNGNITAKNVGTATITADVKASNGQEEKTKSLKCTVAVQDSYTKVTISGSAEVVVGKTITLTAVTEPKDGKITWSSSNDKVAKVDDKGVVTGVAEGTAEIKAVCTDATNISAVHKITVKKSNVDGTTKLKDKDGNQMYYLDASGAYKEATYDDYSKYDKFYKMTSEASAYKYTGWQTIDGSVYFFDKDGNYVTGEQVIQGAKYNFGSDGKMSSGSGSMGIDVSKWNGNIDWNAVKNSGVSYVIIRCGYRGSSTGALIEDPKFRSNIKGAKAAGLKVGVYFFSQAVNEVEAVEEASMALSWASGYGLNYPIFLDVEPSGGRGDGISKEMRTAICKAFCSTVQDSGCSAGIYANKTWLNEKINTGSLTGYKIWLAQYASAPTYTATRYDMWQYSSKGKVSGISGSVDMNISYLNY